MKPHLVSFVLCPFVQRSAILLHEKGVEFETTYIDLDHPPDWFTRISPFGKVPLLRVGEEVLFESAVIMEYLDEITPPSLHPADPLRKAHNRAWFEFASEMFLSQYQMMIAREEAEFTGQLEQLKQKLARLEGQVRGEYFNGPRFNLVDAAFAPFFLRNRLLEGWHGLGLLEGLPRIRGWEAALMGRDSLSRSVVEEFPERLRDYIGRSGGHAAGLFAARERAG